MAKRVNWAYWIAGQAGVIPVAIGSPGVAKTASTKALARKANRVFLPVLLSQVLPEDLGGYPVVRRIERGGREIEVMRRVHDERFVQARTEPSVMLIDELTNAGNSQQAAALQLMADGIEGCWMFAAANPPEQAAAGVDLTPPMVNRLCILPWETDVNAILDGWSHAMEFPEPDVPLLPGDWRSLLHKWGALMRSFIMAFPDMLDAYPRDPMAASQPFPSPRSWTNAATLLAACESVDGGDAVASQLVHGCVGQAAATQFLAWLSKQDLPDPESLLAAPGTLKLPKRGDLALAILGSVIACVERRNSPDRWEAARVVLGVAFTQAQEMAVAANGKLWKCKPANHLPKTPTGALAEMNKLIVGMSKA